MTKAAVWSTQLHCFYCFLFEILYLKSIWSTSIKQRMSSSHFVRMMSLIIMTALSQLQQSYTERPSVEKFSNKNCSEQLHKKRQIAWKKKAWHCTFHPGDHLLLQTLSPQWEQLKKDAGAQKKCQVDTGPQTSWNSTQVSECFKLFLWPEMTTCRFSFMCVAKTKQKQAGGSPFWFYKDFIHIGTV